jgi:hypothetical protein
MHFLAVEKGGKEATDGGISRKSLQREVKSETSTSCLIVTK